MSETRYVTVVGNEGSRLAELAFATERPWWVRLRLGDDDVSEATGNDLFEALLAVRRLLEERGLRICCQGARADVWPSGMSRDMGGGRKAYRLPAAGTEDLVDIFDPADCAEVVTVDEQDETTDRILGIRREA